jgi:acetyltransferase-like isoleucine patch superfamily enzyme
LERGVVLASDVLIQDHAHAYEDVSRPIKLQGPTPGGQIRIGEGCHIGRGAAILGGRGEIVIGKNCVVVPDAVVMSSFPPNSMISGNPARAVDHSCVANDLKGRDSTHEK